MKFLIVSHVEHSQKNGKIYGYGPYIKEMNLWLKYVNEVRIVAPMRKGDPDPIDLAYAHENIIFDTVPAFNLRGTLSKIKTFFILPYIFIKIIWSMIWVAHIHLRCPGNMGLLGAIAQIFFPWKIKTVKYAGNWDPKSTQPFTYRLQKQIISNTILSRNMKVLIYGSWNQQSNNIVAFFTASYHEGEKEKIQPQRLSQEIKILFIGVLSHGKRPIIPVQACHELIKKKIKVHLDLIGDGVERGALQTYIDKHELNKFITLHGNQNSEFVKQKLKSAHFLVLTSKSEGWPKVVAEAMFWGTVPIATNVSCINYMIGEGRRGTLVKPDDISVVNAIENYLQNPLTYEHASSDAIVWSRQFTLESFEVAIKELLNE